MAFYDLGHRKRIKEIINLWKDIEKLVNLAKKNDIDDLFQDNGAKILQQLILMDMKNIPGREGNDAIDRFGIEWEMKSANIALVSGFSTHHHLNIDILNKYKKVPWSFALYEHSDLIEIYVLGMKDMEEMFDRWRNKLLGRNGEKKVSHINNPKIPIKFVKEKGHRVWPIDAKNPIDPATIVKK